MNEEYKPSVNGEQCKGNGVDGNPCWCDECDYYLVCYPSAAVVKDRGAVEE